MSGQPDSEEQGDGDHPHGHFTEADYFSEGFWHPFFILWTQVQIRDMDSQ